LSLKREIERETEEKKGREEVRDAVLKRERERETFGFSCRLKKKQEG
jgi:hypothetical protein